MPAMSLYFLDVAYGFLLLVILLLLRVAPLYRDWAANWTDSDFGQVAVFTPLLLLTTDLLSLPIAIWEHRLALQYQQSIQAWPSWLADWVKGEGVEFSIAILMVWVLFAVIRKSPRKWWFWFWLAAVPLIILGAIVEPVIVEPMFFKFTPLANTQSQLAANIEQMTVRAGAPIPQSRILEMTASAKLRALNAYVSGLGASKRVVVWDTTIRAMSEDEVLFVTGHEMGHYVLGHVRDGILFACAVLLFFLNLAYRAAALDAGTLGKNVGDSRARRSCRAAGSDSAVDGFWISVHTHFKRLQPPPGASGRSVWPGSDARIGSQRSGGRGARISSPWRSRS